MRGSCSAQTLTDPPHLAHPAHLPPTCSWTRTAGACRIHFVGQKKLKIVYTSSAGGEEKVFVLHFEQPAWRTEGVAALRGVGVTEATPSQAEAVPKLAEAGLGGGNFSSSQAGADDGMGEEYEGIPLSQAKWDGSNQGQYMLPTMAPEPHRIREAGAAVRPLQQALPRTRMPDAPPTPASARGARGAQLFHHPSTPKAYAHVTSQAQHGWGGGDEPELIRMPSPPPPVAPPQHLPTAGGGLSDEDIARLAAVLAPTMAKAIATPSPAVERAVDAWPAEEQRAQKRKEPEYQRLRAAGEGGEEVAVRHALRQHSTGLPPPGPLDGALHAAVQALRETAEGSDAEAELLMCLLFQNDVALMAEMGARLARVCAALTLSTAGGETNSRGSKIGTRAQSRAH